VGKKRIFMKFLTQIAAMTIALVLGYATIHVASLGYGYMWPVVSKAEILQETSTKDGVVFYLKFTKNYDCEFLGVNWYVADVRQQLVFLDDGDKRALTRPAGDQVAGPWLLRHLQSTQGTWATVVHRCGLLEVQTSFFP
jgi:hypothetical protein